MSWQVIARRLDDNRKIIIDKCIPTEDDAAYLATEHRQALGKGWLVTYRELPDEVSGLPA